MYRNRSKLEMAERTALASYAVQSSDSRGRLYSESESLYRTAFQKDRDRVLHTSAFRRLEYKTQVFVNYEGDYYRTRLTHTLEVSQVGRTIARALGVNEDLTETIALAHDLGHPPFGHAGERILDGLMVNAGGFDHNKQSFRIVTELEERYPEWLGLNLSWETLEGLVKHETLFDAQDAVNFEPSWKASIEAQIANIADETAYNAHDLDDGLKSGLIHASDLQHLRIWQRMMQMLEMKTHIMTGLERRVLIRELLGWVITDIVDTSANRIEQVGVRSLEDVRQTNQVLVGHSEELQTELTELKTFLFERLYNHFRVVRQVHKAEHFLSTLFTSFVARPKMLPPEVHARIELIGLERAVCDYLSGMTDRFATDEYRRLYESYERT